MIRLVTPDAAGELRLQQTSIFERPARECPVFATFVIGDVSRLTLQQQINLSEWMAYCNRGMQVVSITSVPLLARSGDPCSRDCDKPIESVSNREHRTIESACVPSCMKIPDIAGASGAAELAAGLSGLSDALRAAAAARQTLEQRLAARDVALRQAEQRATRERQAE